MNTQYQIVPGSIGAIAQANNRSIAEAFISCDVVILVDTSGSMSANDSRGGRSRYDVACEELRALQNNLPGRIALVNFSSTVQFEPGGIPTFLQGGTDLTAALRFVKVADVPDMQFILISDGEPNDAKTALAVARTFKNKINVIYVGPEYLPAGRNFLQQLAAATGGKTVTADRAKELQAGVMALLEAGR